MRYFDPNGVERVLLPRQPRLVMLLHYNIRSPTTPSSLARLLEYTSARLLLFTCRDRSFDLYKFDAHFWGAGTVGACPSCLMRHWVAEIWSVNQNRWLQLSDLQPSWVSDTVESYNHNNHTRLWVSRQLLSLASSTIIADCTIHRLLLRTAQDINLLHSPTFTNLHQPPVCWHTYNLICVLNKNFAICTVMKYKTTTLNYFYRKRRINNITADS